MTTKHVPATALPWHVGRPTTKAVEGQKGIWANARGVADVYGYPENAAYIVHAANAYPKLVEGMKKAQQRIEQLAETANTLSIRAGLGRKIHADDFTDFAVTLLRELGETRHEKV